MNLRRILKEFTLEEIKRAPYRDGEIVLEFLSDDDPPKFILYYEEEDEVAEIVYELNSEFFDVNMATTIFDYLLTKI
jgi:hypothetical protein|tara:strand:+ start:1968 stop:2198 length:231 start_codon:yes stop_codon:yes gene_type:complete